MTYSERALDGLARLVALLAQDQPASSEATADLLIQAIEILGSHPLIGRDVGGGMRELVISRGATGYVALYSFDERLDRIDVRAVRHQRETGMGD